MSGADAGDAARGAGALQPPGPTAGGAAESPSTAAAAAAAAAQTLPPTHAPADLRHDRRHRGRLLGPSGIPQLPPPRSLPPSPHTLPHTPIPSCPHTLALSSARTCPPLSSPPAAPPSCARPRTPRPLRADFDDPVARRHAASLRAAWVRPRAPAAGPGALGEVPPTEAPPPL